MSTLTRITDFLQAKASTFLSALDTALRFFSPLARLIAASGGKALLNAAWGAVLAAEAQGGTGDEKFDRAKELILAEMKRQSIAAVMTAVHGAIEGAVAKLNAGRK